MILTGKNEILPIEKKNFNRLKWNFANKKKNLSKVTLPMTKHNILPVKIKFGKSEKKIKLTG